MNEGQGFVQLRLTEDQEAYLAMHLDVESYRAPYSGHMTAVSAAFYMLGAMTAAPERTDNREVEYLAIFTAVFPRMWERYLEFLQLAHTCGAAVEAFLEARGEKLFATNLLPSQQLDATLHWDHETRPAKIDSLQDNIKRIREFTELSDEYVFIPPPRQSVIR